jgi:O-antigen/teichoic acid export membrane protein
MKLPFSQGEFIRSGTTVFLATLLASIIAFAANVIISDFLGPEDFANFKVIVYLFAFLPIIADFGINTTLTKYISDFGKNNAKTGHIIKWFLKVKLVSYLVLIAIAILFRDQIALYFLQDVSQSYLILAGIVFLALNFFLTFSFIVLGFQNFKLFSFSQFLNSTSSAILAVLLSPLGIIYIILGWSLGPLIGNIPCMLFLINKKFNNNVKVDVKRIFYKFSLPIYPVDLSTNLFTVIVPILSLFFSQKLVGYYSFAFIFYFAAMIIPNSLSAVLFPKVSELNGQKKYSHARYILRKSFLYYSLIAIAGLIFVFLFSEWFIRLIAENYLPSLLIFKVIVSLGFIFGYNVIYTNYLKGRGKVKKYALFTLTQNILLILVSFALLNSMTL